MKRRLFNTMLAVSVAAFSTFTSCTKEAENDLPEIVDVLVSGDNSTFEVEFTEDVYAKSDLTGGLTNSNLKLESSDVSFTYTVDHTAGDTKATVHVTYTSAITAGAKITFSAGTSGIYDMDGEGMDSEYSFDVALVESGIIGTWLSEGTNIAPLLSTYFLTEKIVAEFKSDGTYVVHEWQNGNTSTTPSVEYTGTFEMTKSTVGNIWEITIQQSTPQEDTVEGIFEIKYNGAEEVLWYEVVLVTGQGTQNVAPTPELGFGSTNGGTLGAWNIQKYVRL